MAIRQLVLKIASRCNLNCTYCYMYNAGDLTYRMQPKVMSNEVVDSILLKVKNHCKRNQLQEFDFVFHGGEPLLAGFAFFKYFIMQAESILGHGFNYSITVQTNGILITDEWSRFFADHSILVGISLDGVERVQNENRIYHSGKGSFSDVIQGLVKLQKFNAVGIICVIDPYSNPIEYYDLLKELKISRLNTIIPYANYEKMPADNEGYVHEGLTIYADWLIALYDRWAMERNSSLRVMMFDQIISLILGNKNAGNDVLGNTDNELLVIETDGSIEPAGSLKICGDGFTKQGLNITSSELDDAMQKDLVNQYFSSHTNLPLKCSTCPINEVCGGGLFASRYKIENGFDNVSVYCRDLMKLISHIQNTILDLFPVSSTLHNHVKRLEYNQLKEML